MSIMLDFFNKVMTGSFTDDLPSTHQKNSKSTASVIKFGHMFGMSFVLYCAVSISLIMEIQIIPVIFTDPKHIMTARCFLGFCVFNLLGNWMLCMFTRTDYRPIERIIKRPNKRWKDCITCDQMQPPRAYHCTLCNKCILKRDHHCLFTACCIGFTNQKYFIIMCFYAALSAGTSLVMFGFYLNREYKVVPSLDFYHYILPVTLYDWYEGHCTWWIPYYVFSVYLCFSIAVMGTWFFLFELIITAYGQTMYEFDKEIFKYRVGNPIQRFESVFGASCCCAFLLPSPWQDNIGDGINWKTVTMAKHV